ncbi:MAG: glycosyltransferase [Clostridia bacterium]|nr:glycosyltransferase [Clostridia bacterium]
MPLVSIIVPVYKVEAYLGKCVESLVNQTLEDIEIILVDDGSPDNCPAMCDAWAQRDSRVKVIHKENGGLSSARNAALQVCAGAYIGFVDSDDYVDATMFEKLYCSATDYDAQISICAHYTFSEQEQTEHLLPLEESVYEKDAIVENFIFPLIGPDHNKKPVSIEGFVCRQLFRKDLIENTVFRSEKEFFAEDVVFDFDVYPKCSVLSVVNEPLYYYRYNEQSLSNRYRENVWNKLSALLTIKKTVMECFGVAESEKRRLINETIKYIKFSLMNLGKSGCNLSFAEKKRCLKTIRNDKNATVAFESFAVKEESIKTKIIFLLLKFRMYTIILFAMR